MSSPLALPQLAPDIPQVLRLRQPAHGLPELAEALLAEGILKESDWTGEVRSSLRAGLARWVDSALEGRPLRRIFLGIAWANSLAPGMEPSLWLHAVPGRSPEEPIGLLTLTGPVLEEPYDESRDVFVGPTVLALEEHREGLGYQVLGLLQDVLAPVLQAGGPGYGFHHLTFCDELRKRWADTVAKGNPLSFEATCRGAGVQVPRHGLTLEEYLRHVPLAACACPEKLRTHLIHAEVRRGAPEAFREILHAAERLDRVRHLPREALACDTPLFLDTHFSPADAQGGCLKEAPFCIRWSPEDPLPRIYADYVEIARARDAATNVLWMRAFSFSRPDEVRRAVRHWSQVLRVALKACRLAELLHSDEGIPQ